ncbi:ABC transporter permease, partial [Xanthovirga aplysinae]|uniref:ABC transporter permease n=1 Tax=Xanthovirga aplysinae TaxID=2529853 RepID=UPI0012BB4E40
LLIFFWVQDELNYDKHHTQINQLYRLWTDIRLNGENTRQTLTPGPAAVALKNEFPEVKQVSRMRKAGTPFITYKENTFKTEQAAFVDSTLFDVFSIPLVKGDPKKALTDPQTVLIDETTANKIFGKEDPIGKTLIIDHKYSNKISGVFKDFPENSHFHYRVLFPMVSVENYMKNQNWFDYNYQTYVVLHKNASPEALEDKFPDMLQKYVGPQLEQAIGINLDEFVKSGNGLDFHFQPVKDIHLYSSLNEELEANGSITYVYIFSVIAIIILLIGCINYMNLATARSVERAKEVGIRKSIGAFRSQLLFQFLSESLLLSLLSLLLAIGLVEISLPAFNQLAVKSLSSNYLNNGPLLYTIAGIISIVGILSGAYPAFFLSASDPAK